MAAARLAAVSIACAGTLAAAVKPSIERLLENVGHQVESFWNYMPAVTCTELMTQAKVGENGKVLAEQQTAYDYLVLLQASGTEVSVDESRVERTRKESRTKTSFLETNGFAILALIFHPLYQGRYEFTELTDNGAAASSMIRLAFRQVRNSQSPSVLALQDREYPLEWKGTAWIDPATYAVVRIHAELGNSLEDAGLMNLDADVAYAPIPFARSTMYWLPVRAVIEASTRRQHWRNIHMFSGYRRFDVETETKIPTPH